MTLTQTDNKVLNLYPIDYPFETLVDRVGNKKLILNPDFQREYKWDKDGNERASKFIESCLMRIPLPACYFAETETNTHLVIDGVQRITTIKNFFEDKFVLEGLSVFKELNGKKFSELNNLRNELESYTIRCIILRKDNPKSVIREIFARLNQGSIQVSDQEIRHAIYPGNLDNLLKELGNNEIIKSFAAVSKDKRNEEIVLRFFAFYEDNLNNYESNLKIHLDNYMEKNQHIEGEHIEKLRKDFLETLEKCEYVFGDRAFVNAANTQKRKALYLYDLIMWSLSKYEMPVLVEYKEKIVALFDSFCDDTKNQKAINGGLLQKATLTTLRNNWQELLNTLKNN